MIITIGEDGQEATFPRRQYQEATVRSSRSQCKEASGFFALAS
jgi:hypothetical protein